MRALEDLRVAPLLVKKPLEMRNMDSFILPGVGNFGDCARLLVKDGWFDALIEEVGGGRKSLLGVCLGMQMLASSSMEGAEHGATESIAGLGLIPGRVERLSSLGCKLRVPHIGWNEVSCRPGADAEGGGLFDGIPDLTDFYFVHSYAFVPDDPFDMLATTDYGVPITAAVRRGRVWGTQFHPEKSSRAGFRLLRNFIHCASC